MRREHVDWETIAQTLGYADKAAACKDVTRAYEANLALMHDTVDVAKQAELDELDAMAREAWKVLRTEHLRVAEGKVIHYKRRPLLDDGPVLQALDRLLKVAQRRAALLGLDAPTKVETDGHVRYSIEGVDLEALR